MIRYAGLLALVIAAQFTVADGTVTILRAGLWHGDEVTVESGPDWWGIFPEGDGFTLQQAPVTITSEFDAIIDEEGQATGKMVKVPQEAEPVLLVHGITGLNEGTLNTVKTKSLPRMLYPGQSDAITLPDWNDGTWLGLTALGEAKGESDYREVGVFNYQIKITYGPQQNRKRQVIVTIPELKADADPRLVWAGDLDRDGKMDLLFDATHHYNVTHLILFLSSAAKGGELVGKVAEWRTVGC